MAAAAAIRSQGIYVSTLYVTYKREVSVSGTSNESRYRKIRKSRPSQQATPTIQIRAIEDLSDSPLLPSSVGRFIGLQLVSNLDDLLEDGEH